MVNQGVNHPKVTPSFVSLSEPLLLHKLLRDPNLHAHARFHVILIQPRLFSIDTKRCDRTVSFMWAPSGPQGVPFQISLRRIAFSNFWTAARRGQLQPSCEESAVSVSYANARKVLDNDQQVNHADVERAPRNIMTSSRL